MRLFRTLWGVTEGSRTCCRADVTSCPDPSLLRQSRVCIQCGHIVSTVSSYLIFRHYITASAPSTGLVLDMPAVPIASATSKLRCWRRCRAANLWFAVPV